MDSPRNVTLDCTPEPIQIDLDRTAVICIDMQNAFIREGGMFDLAGWPTQDGPSRSSPTAGSSKQRGPRGSRSSSSR